MNAWLFLLGGCLAALFAGKCFFLYLQIDFYSGREWASISSSALYGRNLIVVGLAYANSTALTILVFFNLSVLILLIKKHQLFIRVFTIFVIANFLQVTSNQILNILIVKYSEVAMVEKAFNVIYIIPSVLFGIFWCVFLRFSARAKEIFGGRDRLIAEMGNENDISDNDDIGNEADKNSWLSLFIIPLVIVMVIYAVSQIISGYTGMTYYLGTGWTIGIVVVSSIFQFSLPFTLGSFFCAMNIYGWHWVYALLYAAPGLAGMALMAPAIFLKLYKNIK